MSKALHMYFYRQLFFSVEYTEDNSSTIEFESTQGEDIVHIEFEEAECIEQNIQYMEQENIDNLYPIYQM